ncbi:MAG: hypothetical protein JO061_08550, partial [Acidobacteriaceae bacterium]|nr:hypothetical protein [Acidobacteriaceae bacterium]
AFAAAIKFAQQDVSAAPADREAVVRVGEIYADREMYSQARPWWDRVASVQPGAAEGYLDSATVFWDYFQFGDALRVIEEARRKLHSPWQFSYEAGAIYENQGKFKQAVVAYVNGVNNNGSTDAQARLLTLAGRKTTAELVEEATSRLTTGKYNSGTFQLRLAVLERQNRRPEIESLLSSALTHASGVSDIEEIRSAADRIGFERIAGDAMERTIAVTTDPIEKLQAEIDLGHFYESRNNQGAAEREFSSALQANPERLGVIRAAVDFYWRTKQSDKAVEALLGAADRAQPPYQAELRREAAEKATNSGQFDTARRLLDELLANDPWNGDLLAEKAQTYARQNDAAGLVSFYASELDAMKHAPLEGPDKTNRVAALRRGYVAALIAVGNNTDALEQYQLIVNAYPEDTALVAEVSRFAENHQLSDRLVAYYSKAVSDAPHDYRWPIVLARIDTALRRYPEAIAAYDKASVVRPDRQDIFVAKADLQTRLLRFEDAMHTYAKLYELTFHNSSYLAAQADLNMRMGRPAEALKLLRAAYIDPHPHEAAGFLVVMRQELSWNNFDAVDQLFRELRDTAAKDSGWMVEGVNLEVQALMALHRPQDAIEIAAASLPSNAGPGSAATAIGQAAREYLTPQDKVQLAGFLQAGKAPPPFSTLQLAEAAGLYDLQAELVYKAALVHPDMSSSWPDLQRLQSARLLYEELGQQLDSIAQSRRDSREYGTIMQAAFQAFANAGDTQAELRLISYSGPQYPRLFLEWAGGNLTENVARLATISPRQADAVIQYLISDGSEAAVFESIAARGRSSGALWKNSYTAMAGLYLLSADARVPNAFEAVLGPRTVGGELTNQARQNSLEGGDWFYYASRFGEYLGHRGDAAREDFLPSAVEGNAAASDNYVQLAESYLDIKDKTLAMQALRDALQLSPDRGDVYDRLALLAIEDKERDKAIELWRKAFDLLAARVEQGPLPETYWSTAHNLLVHMNRFRLVSELRGPADEMLQAYARRNGAYRMNDILSGLFEDSPNRGTAVNWMIELSKLPNTDGLLGELLNARWIPEQDKEPLFQAELDARRKALAGAVGNQVDFARQELKRWLVSYISYLEKQKRWPDAWSVLQQIQPAEDRPAVDVVIAAAMTGRLDNLLSGYRAKPESAPSNYEMLNAAQTLEDDGQHEAALALKDFEYSRELQAETSAASAWFGLAEVRFEQKRNEEGLQLIRDVTLTVGEPFSNLGEAIRVLEQNGLLKEAADYSKEWTTAEPWNNEARLTRARLESDSHKLDDLRTSSSVPYRLRVQAAELLREHKTPFAGTDELTLLTHDSIAAGEASRPYFIEARLQAAKTASEQDRIRLYRDAIAFDPSVRDPRLYLAEAAFRAKEDQLGIVALDSYEQAGRIGNVKSNPEAVTVEQLAADAFMVQKNYSRAIRLYEEVLVQVTDSAIRDRTEKSLRAATEQRRI